MRFFLIILLACSLLNASAASAYCFCLKCELRAAYGSFQPFSDSMAPTLEAGDCAISKHVEFRDEKILAGDIAVFAHPISDELYLSRIVGMPNDTVQMIDGVLWINEIAAEQVQQEDYQVIFGETLYRRSMPRCIEPVTVGELCHAERYLETLPNGRSYEILNINDSRLDNTDVFEVPSGHIFVLGDHRDNALDSRVSQRAFGLGFVPIENIIAIVEEIDPN